MSDRKSVEIGGLQRSLRPGILCGVMESFATAWDSRVASTAALKRNNAA
jgi:hypothetical protein